MARLLKYDAFVIPLKLKPFQAPFLIAQAQYINFELGWAQGLRELLLVLDECKIPRLSDPDTEIWRALQMQDAKQLTDTPETLTSNWLSVQHLPPRVFYHGELEMHLSLPQYPSIPYGDGVLSFSAPKDGDGHSKPLEDFLAVGWGALGVPSREARRLFTQLLNVSLSQFMRLKGLETYMMASRRETFWMSSALPGGRIAFRWRNFNGSRQLQGRSLKRGVHWHFAATPTFHIHPFQHVRITSRLVFTTDGATPLNSSLRMHRLRRSFAKGWRNARWRDMLLTFLFWLGDGDSLLTIPVSPLDTFVLRLPPITFISPVSLPAAVEIGDLDEDDPTPDVEGDYFDDDADL